MHSKRDKSLNSVAAFHFRKFVISCSEMPLDAKGNNLLMPAHLSHTFTNTAGRQCPWTSWLFFYEETL